MKKFTNNKKNEGPDNKIKKIGEIITLTIFIAILIILDWVLIKITLINIIINFLILWFYIAQFMEILDSKND